MLNNTEPNPESPLIETSLPKTKKPRNKLTRFLRILGPGLVTGAADDDPSGITTYSQAGAAFGYKLLWAFPLMYPLLVAVQESCARIGAVNGKGLAAIIRDNYSKTILHVLVALVVIANTINIGADLGAMAAAAQLIFPVSFSLYAIMFALCIVLLEITVNYKTYSKLLKWCALMLLAYPITAIISNPPWGEILKATFAPTLNLNFEMVYILVGMLGTTISPYLFFWDTSEVVEDEIASHRLNSEGGAPKLSKKFLQNLRIDNLIGMTLASATAWFITIVCANVLNANGVTQVEHAADAARALEPLLFGFPNAGFIAKIIFSVGIIGLGLLAVPVLAGSSSYAISETFGWKAGLHRKFRKAHGFYGVIILATFVGLCINFLGIDPIKALIFAAVFNGVAAIPLLFIIARIGSSQKIMGEYKNSKLSSTVIYLALLIMSIAAALLVYDAAAKI